MQVFALKLTRGGRVLEPSQELTPHVFDPWLLPRSCQASVEVILGDQRKVRMSLQRYVAASDVVTLATPALRVLVSSHIFPVLLFVFQVVFHHARNFGSFGKGVFALGDRRLAVV